MSCLCTTPQFAYSISASLMNPLYLFGGLLLKKGSIPVYLDWFHYVSWFMYGNEAMSINQWKGVTFNNSQCAYADYNLTSLILPGSVDDNLFQIIQNVFTRYQESIVCSGEDVLAAFNFNPVQDTFI